MTKKQLTAEQEREASFEEPMSVEEAKLNDDSDETIASEVYVEPGQPENVELCDKKITVDGVEYSEHELKQFIKQAKLAGKTRLVLPNAVPSKPGMMLVGRCLIKMDGFGSTVLKGYKSVILPTLVEGQKQKTRIHPDDVVTPAEVMLLAAEHRNNAGGFAILGMEVLGEVKRSNAQEVSRLRGRYGTRKTNAIFPGAIPQMPQSYHEAILIGAETSMPRTGLVHGVEVPDALVDFDGSSSQ